jgi:pSer/pThr/pTyr-binding forkhead associated (FHA) protein
MTIGRTTGNDIVIPDSAMSRQHARVDVSAEGVSVVDLGSLNGVYVNDVRIEDARELTDGDEVRIGRTTLTVHVPEPVAAVAHETGTMRITADQGAEIENGHSSAETTNGIVLVHEESSAPFQAVSAESDVSAPWPTTNGEMKTIVDAAALEPIEQVEELIGTEPPSEEMTIVQAVPRLDDLGLEELSDEPSAAPAGPAGYLVLEDIRTPLYDALTVGRSEGNDIRMESDRMMSRNHARFEAREDGVWFTDLGSANGSYINGERIAEPTQLQNSDEIRCGGTTFHFETAAARAVVATGEDSSATITADEPDDMTLQGVEADAYIREAEVAEFQAMRTGDTEPIAHREAQATDQYRLVVNFGPEAGRSFALLKDVTVIGRASPDADYDVQLNDRAVSRPHAKITRDPDGFVIQDLESANGTWLNYTDEISSPRRLVDGDIVKLGKTTLVYRVPAMVRPATPVQTLDPNLAQVLTFFSLKGGVGTTTLAVNLAVLLRELTEQRVLLIDLSTERGAVSVHLNLAPKLTLADLPTDPALIDTDVVQSILMSHASGVDVLPSPPSPQSAELVTPAAIASVLPILRSYYKWIIIDTSATFSELNLGVFDQSDLLMVVCAPDLTSLKVTQATLDIFAALQIPAEKRVLLLSHVPARSHLQLEDIERTIGERIGLDVPHAGEAVLDSIDRGVPLAVGDSGEPMIAAVRAFAAQLAQVKAAAEVQPRRGGLGRWVQSVVGSLRR